MEPTKEQFETEYATKSGITLNQYKKFFITLPCACDYEGCLGWAAVSNNRDSIESHMELYAPKEMAQATIDDSRWKCPKCGRQKGDFRLLGNGFIQCNGCGEKIHIKTLEKVIND